MKYFNLNKEQVENGDIKLQEKVEQCDRNFKMLEVLVSEIKEENISLSPNIKHANISYKLNINTVNKVIEFRLYEKDVEKNLTFSKLSKKGLFKLLENEIFKSNIHNKAKNEFIFYIISHIDEVKKAIKTIKNKKDIKSPKRSEMRKK